MVAAKGLHFDVVEYLMKNGADLTAIMPGRWGGFNVTNLSFKLDPLKSLLSLWRTNTITDKLGE